MNEQFATLVNAIGWALVHFVWQGALIAAITALLLLLLRNASAQWRYNIGCVALLFCFLVPLWEVLHHWQTSSSFVQVAGSWARQETLVMAYAEPWQFAGSLQAYLQSHLQMIVLGWALVVALLGLRLGAGLWWLRAYGNGQRGQPNVVWQAKLDRLSLRMGVQVEVALKVVKDLQSPITIGFIRPMILLPAALVSGMDPQYLEALLAHELAHIRRYDYLFNLLQNFIEMILFYHPAVWWISKNVRHERENIADDLAARTLGEPRRLALALQELELIQFSTSQLAQAAHGGNLMSRIKRLLRPEVQTIHWKAALTVMSVSGALMAAAAHAVLPGSVGNSVAVNSNPSREWVTSAESSEASYEPALSSGINTDKTWKESKNKSEDVTIPARIDFAKLGCRPEYPRKSLRNEETGKTELAITVAADGKIANVVVRKSSNFPNLDKAVVDQLKSGKCTSTPGTVNGLPASTTTRVDYVWRLDTPKSSKQGETRMNESLVEQDPQGKIDFSRKGCRPEYPRRSIRNEEQGSTELLIDLAADGKMNKVAVKKSSGFRDLDAAVYDKLTKGGCKGLPKIVDGKAVASQVQVIYVWKLD